MTRPSGAAVSRRQLGGELRRLREVAGYRLADVATHLECSQSKLSRLETGKGIPRERDVRDLLELYGVRDDVVRTQLIGLARDGRRPGWWSAFGDVMAPGLSDYVELERDAVRIDAYEDHLVHGLLQTVDYARAVLGVWQGPSRPQVDVERMVEVRQRRQEVLAPDHGLTFRCVLDESTLFRVVGSERILRGQLDHLHRLGTEAPNVEIRIVPFAAGVVPAGGEPFGRLQFESGIDHGLVYIERPSGSEFLSEPADVAVYDLRLQTLLAASLDHNASMERIEAGRRAAGRQQ